MILTVGYQNKFGARSLTAKAWMIMKLTIVLLLFFTFQVSAKSDAQRVTIVRNNIHLSEVFKDIEQQTGYLFFYDKDLIQKTNPIDITLKNATLEQALSACLKGQQLTYAIVKNTIVIRPAQIFQPLVQKILMSKAFDPPPIQIVGRVTDSKGIPLQNVSVLISGTKIGTTTGNDGRFILTSPNDKNIVLEISSVGFITKTVKIGKETEINVTLEQDITGLSDVVVVGYGTQKKATLTGAISVIKGKDILSSKTANNLIENLQGKVAGLQIRQSNSQPGANSTSINIRGFGTPLFVIDGVLRDGAAEFQRIDPNDIESISVLKDGSAAIYGVGADNGVIIVTTKKGQKGKLTVSYSGNMGWSTPTNFPRMVSGSEWVDLKNETRANVWNGTQYSPDETQKYKDGKLPGYESVNWYDETMKKYALQQQHNISLSGGTDATSYFVSLGYTQDGGLLKSNAINYDKINFRTNLTFNLAKGLSMELNLSGRRENNNQIPGGFWVVNKGIVAAAPYQNPYINNDPDFPAYISGSTNPVALTRKDLAGYNLFTTNFLQSSLDLTYDIPNVKGLKIRGFVAYDDNFQSSKYLNRKINLYKADPTTGDPVLANTANSNNISGVTNYNDRLDLQAQLLYNTTIASNNNISATLLYRL
jgi:TonB-linked SusC/RagA family outer membrane protein